MTFSDPEMWDATGQIFLADLHYYTIWPRMTKFGKVTQVVEKHVFRGSATPPTQGVGAQRPQIIWNPPLLTLKRYDLEQPNLVM